MNKPLTGVTRRKLRSSEWFNNPHNPGMTALYLERYLNYGLTRDELQSGKPIIGIAQTGSDLVALQPPPPGAGAAGARGHPRGRRHRDRISGASDPGNRQAPDRRARPQPRLPRAGRNPVRLSARRRGADHRLRQDHARLPDGGGHGQHSGHRAVRRAHAQRLAQGRAHRLRHHRLEGARAAGRRRDRLRGLHRAGRVVGAVDRLLQHHGHRHDHELAGRGAGHVAARLRGDPGALPRARPDGLRDRQAHRRDGARKI